MTSMMPGQRGLKWRSRNSAARLVSPNQAGQPLSQAAQLPMSQRQLLTPRKAGTCEAMIKSDAACVKPIITGALTRLISQP